MDTSVKLDLYDTSFWLFIFLTFKFTSFWFITTKLPYSSFPIIENLNSSSAFAFNLLSSIFSANNSAVDKSAGFIINSRLNTSSEFTDTINLDSPSFGKVFDFSDLTTTNITEDNWLYIWHSTLESVFSIEIFPVNFLLYLVLFFVHF